MDTTCIKNTKFPLFEISTATYTYMEEMSRNITQDDL